MLLSRQFWKYSIYVLGCAGAAGMSVFAENDLWIWFGAAALLWLLATIAQDVILNRIRPWLRSELGFALHMVHKMHGWGKEVRMCIFVPCTIRPNHLRQLIPYVRNEQWSSKRRGLSVHSGIVGCAFRTSEMMAQLLKPDDDFEHEMRRTWGFTDDDIQQMQKDRRAFIAIPILDEDQKAKAVLYCDSSKAESFKAVHQKSLLNLGVELARVL